MPRIKGNGTENVINGTNQSDYITAGAGNDTVYGGNGNDKIYGQAGSDTLHGGKGNDTLNAGSGDTAILYGDQGNDILIGGGTFFGMALYGGSGNDLYVFSEDTPWRAGINDISGPNDKIVLSDMSKSEFNQKVDLYYWDSDSDGKIDALDLEFNGADIVTIYNFYDDKSSDIQEAGRGKGCIESLVLSNKVIDLFDY